MENELCKWIKLGMIIRFIYDGELKLVAPLSLGKINEKSMLLAVYVNSDKPDLIVKPPKEDLRLFEVRKISEVNPTVTDFKIGESYEYLTFRFDSVICCGV